MKKLIYSQIKLSKDRVYDDIIRKANYIRITKQTSQKLLNERIKKEHRVKTAKVQKIRKRIILGTQSSRANLINQRISSANEIRAKSPKRFKKLG
jgi:hypothetical protein